jgi:GDPmannose 4,6-dehydratase
MAERIWQEDHGRMHRRPVAIVVGSAGQDGTLLSRHLRDRAYSVVEVTRTAAKRGDGRTEPLDVADAGQVEALVAEVNPTEIYYLAAHHHSSGEVVGDQATLLQESYKVHGQGFLSFLDGCVRHAPHTRLFYASSALVYGHPDRCPQDEMTPMRPVCAYGITKLFGMGLCELYRREHGLFCSAGILFNHESRFRQPRFVSKKIAMAVAAIKRGLQSEVVLGSLDAEVDWSAASDFVEAMPLTLAADTPQDYVFSSGHRRSLRDFCDVAFSSVSLDFRKYVKVRDDIVFRQPRSVPLQGNPEKLKRCTGWKPKIGFEELVSNLVRAELDQAS